MREKNDNEIRRTLAGQSLRFKTGKKVDDHSSRSVRFGVYKLRRAVQIHNGSLLL